MVTADKASYSMFKPYITESLCKSGKNLKHKKGSLSSTIAGKFFTMLSKKEKHGLQKHKHTLQLISNPLIVKPFVPDAC